MTIGSVVAPVVIAIAVTIAVTIVVAIVVTITEAAIRNVVVRNTPQNLDLFGPVAPLRSFQMHDHFIASLEVTDAVCGSAVPRFHVPFRPDVDHVSPGSKEKALPISGYPHDRSLQLRAIADADRSVDTNLNRVRDDDCPLLGTFIAEYRQPGNEERNRT